jgi:tetratricopeptide (TPR) repeat protein
MLLLLVVFMTLPVTSVAAANPSKAFASPQFNSISGHISDDRRFPISDLQIELLNDVDSILQRTKTDSSGLFVFRGLASGIYQVRVQTYGTDYIGQTQRVQLERTRAFEQLDFVLAVRKSAAINASPGSIFVQEVPDSARKEYERGLALIRKNAKRKDGLAAVQKAIDIFPLYFDALELLGAEYVKDQNFEPAIPLLTKAIEVNSRSYQSLYALSMAQYNLKQLPLAIESMRRAITLNPKSSNANLWLGMLLRQSDKLDEAETYLKQADQLTSSKSPDVHWQLALMFNQLKRYKEAADELELFLKTEPDARDKEQIKKLIQRFRQQSSASGKQ